MVYVTKTDQISSWGCYLVRVFCFYGQVNNETVLKRQIWNKAFCFLLIIHDLAKVCFQ